MREKMALARIEENISKFPLPEILALPQKRMYAPDIFLYGGLSAFAVRNHIMGKLPPCLPFYPSPIPGANKMEGKGKVRGKFDYSVSQTDRIYLRNYTCIDIMDGGRVSFLRPPIGWCRKKLSNISPKECKCIFCTLKDHSPPYQPRLRESLERGFARERNETNFSRSSTIYICSKYSYFET